jgi:selenocysteine-specific elongation factor
VALAPRSLPPSPPEVNAPIDRPLTLGTAGHIDHGKTVLVEALTGVNTDRLPEERRRGISIELGFAPLELPSGRRLSVIDVPGHERFVRTMVAGATGIDLFLLVVAADDGVMPQTREHLAVLVTLGVPSGVVALTKADLVAPEELDLARSDVLELLAQSPYEGSEVVVVSAPRGKGLRELGAGLDRAAASLGDPRSQNGPARLHVDRSFSLKGIGTVVTGTLWSGELAAGDEVRIEPRGLRARVRSVEVHDRSVERASAGQRVALNLGGVGREEVDRGDVVTVGSDLGATYLVDARVDLLPHAGPLCTGARLQLHHGTRETPARVAALEDAAIARGSSAFAQLRLERPIVPAAGDRFVLRQIAPPDTIGGGVVIDPGPHKHGAGPMHVERLRALSSDDPLERVAAALAEAPSGLGPRDADPALLERLRDEKRAQRVGDERTLRWFAPSRFEEVRARIAAKLELEASGRPLSRGALADAAGVDAESAGTLIDGLVAEGVAQPLGPGYVAAGRADAGDEELAPELRRLLAADGIEPRGPEALAEALGAAPERVRKALERLSLGNGVVRVSPGVYFAPEALEKATETVIALCERDGSATIAGLRDELATSRKYAQALLEHLDAEKLTRRVGDEHVLRNRRA